MRRLVFLAAVGAGVLMMPTVGAGGVLDVGYTIQRSDHSEAGARHEFNGGHHIFYPELDKRDSWLEQNVQMLQEAHTFKRGWTTLLLEWPQKVREIVIRKASVGRKDFEGGWIVVKIKTPKGRWVKVYERKNDDIERPVVIRKGLGRLVKGVQISFRTPHTFTLGPVDLR